MVPEAHRIRLEAPRITTPAPVARRLPHNPAYPSRIAVVISNPSNGGLLQLLLEDAGWSVYVYDIFRWLSGTDGSGPQPDIILLEAWALRDPALARCARGMLRDPHAPLILLTEDLSDLSLSRELGAAATLPLLFGLDELGAALHTALNTYLPESARSHRRERYGA